MRNAEQGGWEREKTRRDANGETEAERDSEQEAKSTMIPSKGELSLA